VATRVAMAAHKAWRKIAAREVALEGVRHVARQRRGIGGFSVRDEGFVVLADEAMEEGVLGAEGKIFGRRSEGREGRHAARSAADMPGSWA
jgi:hypothetical protein